MRRAVTSALALVSIGVAVCTVPSAQAAEPLFPAPLHITRQIQDPLAGTTVVLDEYGYGNRLVSVRGSKTSIADYERGELTEIDRDTATYSVTRFEALARRSIASCAGWASAETKNAPGNRRVFLTP